MKLQFEWYEAKAKSNLLKHRVSFELAKLVFLDPHALFLQDRVEKGEMRWQALGSADGDLVLVVAHTVREENGTEIIRLVSARRAECWERKQYAKGFS